MSSLPTAIRQSRRFANEPPVLFYPNFLNSANNLDWFHKSQQLEWTRAKSTCMAN